jgi:GntR family transcriptional regulator, phosphonate transport system regulatory protein
VTRATKSSRRSTAAARDGIALWRSVADEIERSIARGDYTSGAKLPGEMEIADKFRVNRHTVRRAIADLSDRGLVRAERGSGTYVDTLRIPYPIRSRTRFSEIVGSTGRAAGGRLIEGREQPADRDIARRLGIGPGTAVVRLELLRYADKMPLCVGTSWLSAERFPDLARIYAAKRSMTRTMGHFGIDDFRRASTRVSAALADVADALRLELRPGSPLIVVDSIDADVRGNPLLTTRTRFAADRVELLIED